MIYPYYSPTFSIVRTPPALSSSIGLNPGNLLGTQNYNLIGIRLTTLEERYSLFVCLVVFNAVFNNISVISWRSVLLMEETEGP